jgi:ribosomal protein S18 acetylase RimI-like enzyme
MKSFDYVRPATVREAVAAAAQPGAAYLAAGTNLLDLMKGGMTKPKIYELYLRPEFQGLGFGRRLFTAARRDLAQSGIRSLVVWALSDNESAVEFYRALGGRSVARSCEKFGEKTLDMVAYAWQA